MGLSPSLIYFFPPLCSVELGPGMPQVRKAPGPDPAMAVLEALGAAREAPAQHPEARVDVSGIIKW